MEVGIGAGDFDRLVPIERMSAGDRAPVKFYETRLAVSVDQSESMHAEALHHAVAAGNGSIGHHPQHHMRRFRH